MPVTFLCWEEKVWQVDEGAIERTRLMAKAVGRNEVVD